MHDRCLPGQPASGGAGEEPWGSDVSWDEEEMRDIPGSEVLNQLLSRCRC